MICGASLSNGKACQNKVSTGERCWRHKNLPSDAPKPKAAKPKAAPKAEKSKTEKPKTPTKSVTVKRRVAANPKSLSKSESPKEQIVWKSTKKGDTITYTAFHNGKAISYVDMVARCLKDPKILEEFVECIKEISSNTPPFMLRFPEFPSEEDFRFSVTPNEHLNYAPDPKPFQDRFSDEEVAVFENISKDCLLVVPKPPGNFAHLQSFSKEASFQRQVRFWNMVFTQLRRVSKGRKVWLNTHGLGDHWLHVRLDFEPKYYPTAEKSVSSNASQKDILTKFPKPDYSDVGHKLKRVVKTINGDKLELRMTLMYGDLLEVIMHLKPKAVTDLMSQCRLLYEKSNNQWILFESSCVVDSKSYDYRKAMKGSNGPGLRIKGQPEMGQKPPQYILDFFDPN